VKVVDFGLCTKATSPDGLLDDFCGSPGFFAPEILLRDRYDGRKADVWSLGCILLEVRPGSSFSFGSEGRF
jgi:serine/threonine protein kinase